MMENIVVVIDGGGRGAALVDKYLQSPHVDKVFSIPGNDMMMVDTADRVTTFPKLKTTDMKDILNLCLEYRVVLVDVAQDNGIEAGLTDRLREAGIKVCGPTKKAGQIEWDKTWARLFGQRCGLPQPSFEVCQTEEDGIKYLLSRPEDEWHFLKAAFLAEGKGAVGAKGRRDAMEQLSLLRERFPKAARRYLVEQWMLNNDGTAGEEFSTFVLCCGEDLQIIGSAQDHKRVFDGDKGGNTGGMGCSSHPLVLTADIQRKSEEIIRKTLTSLASEGRPYTGILYEGGILLQRGNYLNPFVMEFNARWGDPEAQVIVPSLENDLFEMSMAVAEGNIKNLQIITDGKVRVAVAGVSRGYPEDYSQVNGKEIIGLDKIMGMDGIKVFGAGVKVVDDKYYAAGGRLFYVVGEGKDILEARQKAYEAINQVYIKGGGLHYRTDIGRRDVLRLTRQRD
ncbi:MAG: phosphoribosylamine--glycine ligase [Armatimonadetes bacterium]|nr:MAG: phosphoribosylamine--glycine ligase [Armatimonadota bacterium]